MSPETQILHHCLNVVQHGGHHWDFSLRLLHDTPQVLTHYQEHFTWELLLEKRAFNLVLLVKQVLLGEWENWPVYILPEILYQVWVLEPSAEVERASMLASSIEADFFLFA